MPNLPIQQELNAVEDKGIDTCTTCPKLCRWTCPVTEAEARETTSPWNLVILSGYMKRGLAAVDAIGDLPYHCTFCGACQSFCLHDNDVPLWMALARSRLQDAHAEPEAVREVRGHFGTGGNPYGVALDGALSEIVRTARGEAGVPSSGPMLYLPGCATIREMPEAAAAFLRALALFGIGGVAVNEASAACCGLPLLWAGDLGGFQAHAKRHAARLSGAGTVIVQDPACAHAMKVRYPEFGAKIDAEIRHVSELLAERLGVMSTPGSSASASEPAGGAAERVAYLDSCSLARGLGAVNEPRRLVARASGRTPIELPGLRGAEADCCGASGLLPVTAPDAAEAMAQARIQAFRESGATRLVTFSPRCAAHIQRVDPTVPVADATMLLAEVK